MIISMAWTTHSFLLGVKSVTRRSWTGDYAKRFKKGMIVDVYDKSPRFGGKKVGELRVTKDPYSQMLRDMPDDHFEREGGTLHWKDKADFIEKMGGPYEIYWVLEFERLAYAKPA